MLRKASLFVVVLALLCSVSTAFAENILYRESFEDGFGQWITTPTKDIGSLVDDFAHDGKMSLKTLGETKQAMDLVFDEPQVGKITIWFYDTLESAAQVAQVGMAPFGYILVGVQTNVSKTNYVYRPGTPNYVVTEVARIEGWNKFTWVVDGEKMTAYINDAKIAETTDVGAFDKITLGSLWGPPHPTGVGYWDDVTIESLE